MKEGSKISAYPQKEKIMGDRRSFNLTKLQMSASMLSWWIVGKCKYFFLSEYFELNQVSFFLVTYGKEIFPMIRVRKADKV